MKRFLLTIIISVFSVGLNAQFSETFFNSLAAGTDNYTSNELLLVDGIEIEGGFLQIFIADSAGTNVQFAKIDYSGANYETYSSTLPNTYTSGFTYLIDSYQNGNDLYLIISNRENDKLGVVHYENYQFVDYVEAPIGFSTYQRTYTTSSLEEQTNDVHVYIVNENNQLMRYTFNLSNMSYSSNVVLFSNVNPTFFNVNQSIPQSIFVVPNSNEEKILYSTHHSIYQTSIVNNNAQTTLLLDSFDILGVYEENYDYFILTKDFSSTNVHKYVLFDNDLSAQSILDYMLPQINGATTLRFTHLNNKDYWLRNNFGYNGLRIDVIDNNGVVVDSVKYNSTYFNPRKWEASYNKIFSVGINRKGYYGLNDMAHNNAPYIFWADIHSIDFQERSSWYDFGKFRFSAESGLAIFNEGDNQTACFGIKETNYGGNKLPATIYYSSFFLAAKDTNGYVRGNRFKVFFNQFIPGPITDPQQITQETLHKYDENFYVDVYMIGNHIQQTASQNSNYIPPKGILNWPGNGNPNIGQAVQLAPFVDVNNNGLYEPYIGDYPDFPGTRCLLAISQDPLNGSSDTSNTGFEAYRYIYNYDCEDEAMKNTVFTRLVIKNRSDITYDSVIIGVINDFDIGGPSDDYEGTNVSLGLSYAYNGYNYDDTTQTSLGFGNNPPAQGFAILKSNALPSDGIDNAVGIGNMETVNGFGFGDGIVDNEYWGMEVSIPFYRLDMGGAIPGVNDDPISPQNNFYYLTSRFKDNSHMVYGGTGHFSSFGSTNILSNYVYPNESDPLHYGTNGIDPGFAWSEITNNNPTGDRRIISVGSSEKLLPGGTMIIEGAFVYGRDVNPASQMYGTADLFAKTAQIRQYFQEGVTPCGQKFGNNGDISEYLGLEENEDLTEYIVYPNPSNGIVRIKGLKGNENIQVWDYSGRKIQTKAVNGQINLSKCSIGLYFVVINNSKERQIFKVIRR